MAELSFKDMKKAIVVGASSGIGREVARLLIQAGWAVGVAARREERLQELEVLAADRVEVERIDVTSSEAAERLRTLIDRLGGMDLFVYASGIGRQNRELREDTELSTAETNAVGFMRMVGEACRYFAADPAVARSRPMSGGGRWGHIAVISSIAGTKGLGPAPAYSATKALQNVYIQALEQQAHTRGLRIRFTDIRPGFVDTDLLSGDFRYPMLLKPERVARRIVQAVQQGRHVCIIDWRYRVLTAAWRRIPRWLWRLMRL